MNNKTKTTEVFTGYWTVKHFQVVPALFGLLSFKRLMRIDRVDGDELHIVCDKEPPKVFVNNEEYIKVNPSSK